MKTHNKLILGTVQFGLDYGVNNHIGKPDCTKVKEILDFAYNNNIRILDTAEAYGDAHERIGAYHCGVNNRFKVITKFSPSQIDLPKDIIKRVKMNLRTLGVKSLYGYMFHSYEDFKHYFSSFEADLGLLKNQGIINKIGVSLHSNQELEDVLKFENIDLIQLPFNLLDNSFQRKTVLNKAKEKGVEIHTRSVFLQGLFFKDIDKIKGNPQQIIPEILELRKLTSGMLGIADIALNYVCRQTFIDKVLVGVDNIDQLKLNLLSLDKNLSENIVRSIENIEVKDKILLNPSKW